VDYTSVKENFLQSWRYKTLTVIKFYKKHLSFKKASYPRTQQRNNGENIVFMVAG